MARGSAVAQEGATTGLAQNKALFNQSGALYSTLAPQLAAQAANPRGMGPQDLARADTAAQQSAGGSQAAATGEASLIEGRTRNAGGLGMALGKAAREGGRQLSEATLGTRMADTELKENQRKEAIRGEEGLYGTSLAGSGQSLGQVASNVNADTGAKDASWNWSKYIMSPLLSAAGGAAPLFAPHR